MQTNNPSEPTDSANRFGSGGFVRWIACLIYWPLHLTGWALIIGALAGIVAGLIYRICQAIAWCWNNWHTACQIAVVTACGTIIVMAYEWAKRNKGKHPNE